MTVWLKSLEEPAVDLQSPQEACLIALSVSSPSVVGNTCKPLQCRATDADLAKGGGGGPAQLERFVALNSPPSVGLKQGFIYISERGRQNVD